VQQHAIQRKELAAATRAHSAHQSLGFCEIGGQQWNGMHAVTTCR
jgi:hypothetical protein